MSWTRKNNSVELNDYLESVLDKLADKVDFDFVITSGIRDPKLQAAAMFGKIEAGDVDLSDYRNREFANSVITAFPDLTAATQAVIDAAQKGIASFHLIGRAFDIRTRNLNSLQIDQLSNAIKEIDPGSKPLLEFEPPHLHIRVSPPPKKSLWIASLIILGAVWIFRD